MFLLLSLGALFVCRSVNSNLSEFEGQVRESLDVAMGIIEHFIFFALITTDNCFNSKIIGEK